MTRLRTYLHIFIGGSSDGAEKQLTYATFAQLRMLTGNFCLGRTENLLILGSQQGWSDGIPFEWGEVTSVQ